MNIINRNFFRILRAGALDENEPLEPMSEFKWNRLFQMIKSQNVSAIALEGIQARRDDENNNIPSELVAELQASVYEAPKTKTQHAHSFEVPSLSNPILDHKLKKIFNNERHSIDTNIDSLRLLGIIIDNVQTILNKGMSLGGVLELGKFLRTMGDKVDFTAVKEAAWVGLPFAMQDTVFSIFSNPDSSLMISAIIGIMPIAIATIVEHIGDMSAISSTVGENFIEEPGLHRTLLGDGLATMLASLFGAPANTTYGENTGVLNLTKVYDPMVIRLAAIFAIIFSFSPKFAALVSSMPAATVGGVSIVLYGMISAVGVRNVVENNVDFKNNRNVIIAALILVLSIGISYSSVGAISFTIGAINISLSGLAVGSLVGIILNAVLPGKDYSFDAKGEESANLKV